jgi:4-methyl-5(b-hydroxyethyl)-thiazole monophosphate biosynthesis
MERHALVPIADGTEELEAVCIIDVLRRAGAAVTIASIDMLQIVASKGVKIVADCLIAECNDKTFDLIALPGGMPGAEHLRDSKELISMLKRHRDEGRLYSAICAAPAIVLYTHGLLEGHRFTCHPNFAHLLKDVTPVDSPVVVDGNLITSRGAGTVIVFSLKLVELLFDEQKVREVAQGMALSLECGA